MNCIELKAPAKINLSIDVLSKRPDGYHNVQMIMQSISLYDRVIIEEIKSGIEIKCNNPNIPCDEKNIAFKAAKIIMETHNISSGVKITLFKKVPHSAGLAGGSTDAAAVLKGINTIFELGLNNNALAEYGKNIGSDVPFCINGGTMLAEGIGEMLTKLEPLLETYIVLIKPKISVSTAWVYSNLNLSEITERPDTSFLINAIKEKNIESVAKNMKNVLESVTIKEYPIIAQIKQKLIDLGAAGSIMSGSGPSVFGVFLDRKQAEYAFETMMKYNEVNAFLVKTM